MEKEKLSLKSITGIPKYLLLGAVGVVIVAVILLFVFAGGGETSIEVETALKEVVLASELRTAKYTYNSIAEIKDGDKTKYHAYYTGTVSMGVDFEEIEIKRNGDVIQVIIPQIEIQDVNVETKIDFIFVKEKYNTEKCFAEAYSVCEEDLKSKAAANETLLKTAKESVKNTLEALMKPFEQYLQEGETIEIVFADANKEVAE